MADLEFIANMNISPLTINELKELGWNQVVLLRLCLK